MAKRTTKKTVSRAAKTTTTKLPPGKILKGEFFVPLVDEDILRIGKELAAENNSLKAIVVQKKAINADLNVKIRALNETINELAQAIKEGKRKRSIEVEVVKDFDSNTVRYMYKGTSVEERAMTAEDRQEDLLIDEDELRRSLENEVKRRKEKKAKTTITESTAADEVHQVIKMETSRKTKRSALDGSYSKEQQLES